MCSLPPLEHVWSSLIARLIHLTCRRHVSNRASSLEALRSEDEAELFASEDEALYSHRVVQLLERGTGMLVRQSLGLHLGNVDQSATDAEDLILGDRYRRIHRFHDDVYDHSDQRQTNEHVDARRQEELGMRRNDVAEADRRERNDQEVERLQVGPRFPYAIERHAEDYVEHCYRQCNDRRQVELVVDFERHHVRLVDRFQSLQLGLRLGGSRRHARVRLVGIVCRRRRLPLAGRQPAERAPVDAISDALHEGHPEAAERNHVTDAPEAAGVVEEENERPEVLDGSRQQLADAGENDEAQGYANRRIDHRNDTARRSHRDDVAVSCTHAHTRAPSNSDKAIRDNDASRQYNRRRVDCFIHCRSCVAQANRQDRTGRWRHGGRRGGGGRARVCIYTT
jgi:hypothetical protein